MAEFRQPTDEQRRVIDVVVETWLKKGSWVLGREIRFGPKLRDLPTVAAVLKSCVPYYLSVRGPSPSEAYDLTLAGLVASHETAWVSRALEGVIRHLAKKLDEDPGSPEYQLSDLRRLVPELESTNSNRVYELLQIAHLTGQAIPMPDNEYRFVMPEHIETVARWKEFGDLLGYELSRLERIEAEQRSRKEVDKPAAGTPFEFETMFHKYRRVGEAGQGAAGVVFEVEDEDGVRYAMKRLRPERPGTIHLKRFENELAYCRRTGHPNIIRVVDSGFEMVGDNKVPFYVMPLYPGTLRKRIEAKLGHEEAIRIFRDIANGLAAAHADKIWHRDLKPENILIAGDGTAVIADFGIAHFADELQATSVRTQPGDRVGNYAYSSPEQKRLDPNVDGAADVYALGFILTEMITGIVLDGRNAPTIASKVPALGGLDVLVDRMLEHAPGQRPKASELLSLLDAALAGKLLAAGPRVVSLGASGTGRLIEPPAPSDANRLARHICTSSVLGLTGGEAYPPAALRSALGLSDEDFRLAVDELRERGLVDVQDFLAQPLHAIMATWRLFFEFDAIEKGWITKEDALAVAKEVVRENVGSSVQKLAARLEWPPRRMNPACAYLEAMGKVEVGHRMGGGDFAFSDLIPTDRTRRLVRDGW